jgi:hypothetical protein
MAALEAEEIGNPVEQALEEARVQRALTTLTHKLAAEPDTEAGSPGTSGGAHASAKRRGPSSV